MKKAIEIGETRIERLDDIPVLFGHLERMRVQEIIDQVIVPHGNWTGLSPGWVITIWLIHILSVHSHRMEHVQEWVAKHLETLEILTRQKIRELDFTDDRLALCLRMLNFSEHWQKIEFSLGQHLLRVYRLEDMLQVRLDASTWSVYADPAQHTLFKLGKAKNGQYETQYKMMLASLDPLGLPLAVDILPGNYADDPLYLPSYRRSKNVLQENGILVVGDSKMSALKTRATIASEGDFYLAPLAHRKDEPELLDDLLSPWVGREGEMERIFLPKDAPQEGQVPDEKLALAYGFEVTRPRQDKVANQFFEWTERLLVVRSTQFAKSSLNLLHKRLEKAEKALKSLTPTRGRGKHQIKDESELLASIQSIEKKYRVQGFFEFDYQEEVTEKKVRAYGKRSARIERKVRFQLTLKRNQEAIAKAEAKTGWRIYATNAPIEKFPLVKTVLAYRDQYIVENVFRRLQGKILSITPVYVQRDDHAKGLFHLLTIAARVLALGDHLAKVALAEENSELAGIYAGNPKRSTPTPTTERMLEVFDNINLLIISVNGQILYQVTPLTKVQLRILELWSLPVDFYSQFAS